MAPRPDVLVWRIQAACRTSDPELFFPVGTGAARERQILAAKAVCIVCVVRPQCLSAAMALGELEGVWGGTSPDERVRLRLSRAS